MVKIFVGELDRVVVTPWSSHAPKAKSSVRRLSRNSRAQESWRRAAEVIVERRSGDKCGPPRDSDVLPRCDGELRDIVSSKAAGICLNCRRLSYSLALLVSHTRSAREFSVRTTLYGLTPSRRCQHHFVDVNAAPRCPKTQHHCQRQDRQLNTASSCPVFVVGPVVRRTSAVTSLVGSRGSTGCCTDFAEAIAPRRSMTNHHNVMTLERLVLFI